jgi:hypothetical protein
MARNLASYVLEIASVDGNPETICQFVPASDHPMVMHNVMVGPLGATGASAPLQFDFLAQTSQGTLTDDTASLTKIEPILAATIQMAVYKTAHGAEPSTESGGQHQALALHQQNTGLWVPATPFKEILIPSGKRLGFRYLDAAAMSFLLSFTLEE